MLFTFIQAIKSAYVKDINGATAIEYGLIAGGISLAIVASVFAFGGDLATLFSTIADKMAEASGTISGGDGAGGGE